VRAHLRPAAAHNGFAEPDVLMRWREIVGEALSDLCHPVKVSYRKGSDLGATLMVHAEGAVAPQVELSGPMILERVNSYYGYRAVARLQITQGTGEAGRAGGFAESAARFRGRDDIANPSGPALAEAATLTSGIRNKKLRAALTRMGAYVFGKPTAPRR